MRSGSRKRGRRIRADAQVVIRVRRKLLAWGRANGRDFPWRAPGATEYQVAIAEVLLKRTTATAAARLFPEFMAKYADWAALAQARRNRLEALLKPIGLSAQRAKDLRLLARVASAEYGGKLPRTLHGLLGLPAIGPYSARAVMSIAMGQKAAIVDSNVVRVLSRIYGLRKKSASAGAVQELADRVVAPRAHRAFNLAVLDLAAAVCRYDRPRCEVCPLTGECRYFARKSGAAATTPPLPAIHRRR